MKLFRPTCLLTLLVLLSSAFVSCEKIRGPEEENSKTKGAKGANSNNKNHWDGHAKKGGNNDRNPDDTIFHINPFTKNSFRFNKQQAVQEFNTASSMNFMELLTPEARKDIHNFDKVSTAMNITIANFYTFMEEVLHHDEKKVVEDGESAAGMPVAVRKETDDERFDRELGLNIDDDDEYFLKGKGSDLPDSEFDVGNIAKLLGVNNTAVDFILQKLYLKRYDLMSAFDTADTVLVLLNLVASLEQSGHVISIRDLILAFCDEDGMFNELALRPNLKNHHGIEAHYLDDWLEMMRGSSIELEDDIYEIAEYDTCARFGKNQKKNKIKRRPPTVEEISSKMGYDAGKKSKLRKA